MGCLFCFVFGPVGAMSQTGDLECFSGIRSRVLLSSADNQDMFVFSSAFVYVCCVSFIAFFFSYSNDDKTGSMFMVIFITYSSNTILCCYCYQMDNMWLYFAVFLYLLSYYDYFEFNGGCDWNRKIYMVLPRLLVKHGTPYSSIFPICPYHEPSLYLSHLFIYFFLLFIFLILTETGTH